MHREGEEEKRGRKAVVSHDGLHHTGLAFTGQSLNFIARGSATRPGASTVATASRENGAPHGTVPTHRAAYCAAGVPGCPRNATRAQWYAGQISVELHRDAVV